MIYGQQSDSGSKIGMGNESNVYDWRRKTRTINQFYAYAGYPPPTPHLETGSGASASRTAFKEIPIETIDLDLDCDPYPDKWVERFRTVTSIETLEHLYNPLFHLQQVHRVLHPEGKLFLTTPNDWSLIYKTEHVLSRKFGPHFHQFSEWDLRQIMARAGLKILHIEKFTRGPVGTLARISKNVFFLVCSKESPQPSMQTIEHRALDRN